jgi:RecQ family ATP-dependent DNA helicase
MDPESRRQIVQLVCNIIAPGGRAFFPYELEQALQAVARGQHIPILGKRELLGEFWLRTDSDPQRTQKVDLLRSVSKGIHEGYARQQEVKYGPLAALVYALYYLHRNLHKIQFILLLDIGAGVGTVPLACADFYELLRHAHSLFDQEFLPADVSFTCVDSSPHNIEIFEQIKRNLTTTGSRFTTQCLPPVRVDGSANWRESLPPDQMYNMIFMSNFLAEQPVLTTLEQSLLVLDAMRQLTDDGLLVIVEPADRENSQRYHALQRELVRAGLHVLFPCDQVNGAADSASCAQCWAFRAERFKTPDLAKPLIWSEKKQTASDDEIKWCYGVFRRFPEPNPVELTSLQSLPNEQDRIEEIIVRVMSPPLDKGTSLRVCGEEARSDLAILRVAEHQVVPNVPYGGTVRLKNAHVRRTVSTGSKASPHEYEIIYDVQTEAQVEGATQSGQVTPRLLIRDAEAKTESLRYFLRRLFGFEDFREGQLDVLSRILSGQDVLAIMATSGGKSLCFQLPAALLPGVVIVVAPLLSLMRDQRHNLRMQFGFDHVERINSELTPHEREEVLERMAEGYYKLIYITPEQLMKERVIAKLSETARRQGITLFAIDEVHCLSQWGHDFRPAYLNLRRHFTEIDAGAPERGSTPILSLTATASELVISDVMEELELPPEALRRYSFDRPELSFEVVKTRTPAGRQAALIHILAHKLQEVLGSGARPGIIFVPYTGEGLDESWTSGWLFSAEGLKSELAKRGYRTDRYHGKLDSFEGERVQQAFKDGELDFLVATKGFGMGIDQADIRFVIHYSMPDSLESYYQEAGRAGRDQSHAHCVLLYEVPDESGRSEESYPTDYDRQLYFIENEYPRSKDDIKQVWDYLLSSPTIRRDDEHGVLYQAEDDLIINLGWMTREQVDACSKAEQLQSYRREAIKAWNELLRVVQTGDTKSRAFQSSVRKLRRVSGSIQRAATQDDWGYLLYKVKRHRRIGWIRQQIRQALGGAQMGDRRAAALADLMRRKPDRDLLDLKAERYQGLKVVLDALRRMRFVYAWNSIQTRASVKRKYSWVQIEESVRDPLVCRFIDTLKDRLQASAEYLSQAPIRASEDVDLVEYSIDLGMPVTEIQDVFDFLYRRHFLSKKPDYRTPQLIIRLDKHVMSLPEQEREAAIAGEMEMLYRRREREIGMLDDMQRYVHTSACRRQSIVGYFLQQAQQKIIVKCNFCDNCCPGGIVGDRAQVEEATRRQVDLVERLRAWLDQDFEDTDQPVASALRGGTAMLRELRAQEDETAIWDLVMGICAFHLENRKVDSWRATAAMVLIDYEQANWEAGERHLHQLRQHLHQDWMALELFASMLGDYTHGQYPVVSLMYEAANHLERPKEQQLQLLRRLVEIDYERDPTVLYTLGRLEAELGQEEYAEHLNDALAGWLRTAQASKAEAAASELLIAGSELQQLVPLWAERIGLASPNQALELLDALVRQGQEPAHPVIADSLRRILNAVSLSGRLLAKAAKVAAAIGQPSMELELWHRILDQTPESAPVDQDDFRQAYAALATLHSPNGPFPDAARYGDSVIHLARLCEDPASAVKHYAAVVTRWSWETLVGEAEACLAEGRYDPITGLLCAWVAVSNSELSRRRAQLVTDYLEAAGSSLLEHTAVEHARLLIATLGVPKLAVRPVVVEGLARLLLGCEQTAPRDLQLGLQLCLAALASGQAVPEHMLQTINRILFTEANDDISAAQLVHSSVEDDRQIPTIMAALAREFQPTATDQLESWFELFAASSHLAAGSDTCLRVLVSAARLSLPSNDSPLSDSTLTEMKKIVEGLLSDRRHAQEAHEIWLAFCGYRASHLSDYVVTCLQANPSLGDWAEEAFSCLLETTHPLEIRSCLERIASGPKGNLPPRIARSTLFFRLVRDHLEGFDPPYSVEDLLRLGDDLKVEKDIDRCDMYVAASRALRDAFHLDDPRVFREEALALRQARRYSEAAQLAADHQSLSLGPIYGAERDPTLQHQDYTRIMESCFIGE